MHNNDCFVELHSALVLFEDKRIDEGEDETLESQYEKQGSLQVIKYAIARAGVLKNLYPDEESDWTAYAVFTTSQSVRIFRPSIFKDSSKEPVVFATPLMPLLLCTSDGSPTGFIALARAFCHPRQRSCETLHRPCVANLQLHLPNGKLLRLGNRLGVGGSSDVFE